MDCETFDKTIITKAMSTYAAIPGMPSCNDNARLLLLAIAGQESSWRYRRQSNYGPAAGFWQFEKGGGVKGVLFSLSTRDYALALCKFCMVSPTPLNVWGAIQDGTESGDLLAFGFSRLLLWSDPRPLPNIFNDESGAWGYYIRNWRPGKPSLDRWGDVCSDVSNYLRPAV